MILSRFDVEREGKIDVSEMKFVLKNLPVKLSDDEAEWSTSMSRLDPRNCWRQLSFAIKNQLRHPKPPTRGVFHALRWFFMA